MIRQLFKLIWNRKWHNLLLLVEIVFSCLVIFIISEVLIHNLKSYYVPLGYQYTNRLSLEVVWPALSRSAVPQDRALLRERYQTIDHELGNFTEIEQASWSSPNLPYMGYCWTRGVDYQSVSTTSDYFYADDRFLNAAGLQLIKGRWFDRSDDARGQKSAVISRNLELALFGQAGGVGKTLGHYAEGVKIIGVVSDYRYMGEYTGARNCLFFRGTLTDTTAQMFGSYLIKLKPGSGLMTEDRIVRRISDIYPDAKITLSNLEDKRRDYLKPTATRIVVLSMVSGFLILNVALGLFGILWHTINKRRSEIGLRRALGATRRMIALQIVGEMLVMCTISIVLGAVFEAQLTILNPFDFTTMEYVFGILSSILFIYLVTAACALYPAYLASGIDAATALHEE